MKSEIKNKKKGFTLVELMIVLIIMAIIAAIAIPSFINYWRNAEFRKNESNAKTVYLAAESKLTYYRSSGQWDKFKEQVKKQGKSANFFKDDASTTFDETRLNGRIYAITLDSDASKAEQEKNPVMQLLGDYLTEGDFLKGSIGIEIDVETGEVYSVFYGTKCKGLNYKSEDADGYLTMQKRDYDSRKKRLLGYYSTQDVTNVVKLKPTKLRITTINLQNSEKLSLNWSSNVGQAQDVSYEVSFYNKAKTSDNLLFTMTISPYDLRTAGWSSSTESTDNMASVELKDKNGTSKGNWSFPLTYSDNKYSLVLDAMMSAKVQKAINDVTDTVTKTNLERTSSTSICRLQAVTAELATQQNIYATVKATPYKGTQTKTGGKEYKESELAKSNSANTMYADQTSGENIKLAAFRHLSNIRYYDKSKKASFIFTNKNMEWTAVGTGLYDFQMTTRTGTEIEKLVWTPNNVSAPLDFPEIAELSENHTLKGEGTKTLVSGLKFGKDSITDGVTYLGLFGEIKGNVEDVTLRNATLTYDASATDSYASVEAAGILTGRCQGNLTNVTVQSEKTTGRKTQKATSNGTTVNVTLNNQNCSAIGGVVGLVAKEGTKNNGNNTYQRVDNRKLTNVSFYGEVEAVLPEKIITAGMNMESDATYGIGGIAGVAKLKNNDKTGMIQCENHASVSGNYCTGGIVGKLDGEFTTKSDLSNTANIRKSSNEGLILCTSDTSESTLTGKYFGGIVGYGYQALVHESYSASGRASNFSFNSKKTDLLKGKYVGGIIGYGQSSLINNCSTQKNGYVLGSEQVGGIAGALSGNIADVIKAEGTIKVTTNASYVIGKKYVGGIVGENSSGVTLENCVNNGVAAGYEKYVGGIVGYNANGATIKDCASYLSDYDNSVFKMITETWDATADYAGGIAGYNNGSINFSNESTAVTVKSVSSIVVGNNYVGGVAGFNDICGSLDIHYTLIGGRVYGYKDCVGGGFGFNASEKLLTQNLTIKPRSVQGRYYVGGCIGANVVNLSTDVEMSKFRCDNILGSIKGEAFCGGIIGYQRTYGSGQLAAEPESGSNSANSIFRAVEKNRTSSTDKILPVVQDNNVPTNALASTNTYKLTVSTSGNTNDKLSVETNNVPIQANLYAGGVIGYCERSSNLVVKNCLNSGNLSNLSGSKSVKLNDLIRSEIDTDFSNEENPSIHAVGGIISVNLENQIIDHCSNSGSMSGYTGTGGVVGLNAGLVVNCKLEEHFGNASLDYLGGIAGINVGKSSETGSTKSYTSADGAVTYTAGTITKCTTEAGKTISGKNNIGGIVGWNLQNATLSENTSYANLSGAGDAVGGIAGRNSGKIEAVKYQQQGTTTQKISSNGSAVGGLVGVNELDGIIQATGTSAATERVVIGTNVSINGQQKVGGIVGVNYGQLGGAASEYLTCSAEQVRARRGIAGGIVGETNGNIEHVVNRTQTVTADSGTAGGITAEVQAGKIISDCKNSGSVRSSAGYAGGIAATNDGTIRDCKVEGTSAKDTLIYSLGKDEIGAITAVNEATGTIQNSSPGANVKLQSDGTKFGGITGQNLGIVEQATLTNMPAIESTQTSLAVGGAVGENLGAVTYINSDKLNFQDFSGYKYLGGIVGINGSKTNGTAISSANVQYSTYSGSMTERASTSKAGNCYGGIAGINYATLSGNKVAQITMTIDGIYTATSTSTEDQKEAAATHAGGITGKNAENAVIENCILEDNAQSKLTAKNGMLGGIAGFNKGTIRMSGSDKTTLILSEIDVEQTTFSNLDILDEKASKQLSADENAVNAGNIKDITNMTYYSTKKKVSDGRLRINVETNGNLGGITAYNGTTGEMTGCVSGNWFLVNKSQAIGVGTGGVIGMNSSEKNLNGLINGAFVGRQLPNGVTNRFAGGIIGNQNNSSSSGWVINNCINYGTVYCYNTHYSGGIMGQWTGSGGTIQNCRNYGNLQTTYQEGWVGASGGIVAQLYHAYEQNEYNIISCGNFGNIYTKTGATKDSAGANDSAGILGNITAYYTANQNDGQKYTIQVLDCVNGPGVEIYSKSMASGIVGFLSADKTSSGQINANTIINSTQNITLRIERCQNYANNLQGSNFVGGIFGDRYGESGCKNTIITDCYSINKESYSPGDYPIWSFNTSNSKPSSIEKQNKANNYFIQMGFQKYWYGWDHLVNLGFENNNSTRSDNEHGYILEENGYSNQYAFYSCLYRDETNQRYAISTMYPNYSIDPQNDTITETGYIIPKSEYPYLSTDITQVHPKGKVLFYLDETFNNLPFGSGEGQVANAILKKGSSYYKLARKGYKNTEGIENNKILAPESATASIAKGKVSVNITPKALPKALKGEQCNPFKYNIILSDEKGNTDTRVIYTESGSFDLPSNLSGTLTVQVQAVSMLDDVEPSDVIDAQTQQAQKVLPTPDVKVELNQIAEKIYVNKDSNYTYRITLNNLSDYDSYTGWQVKVSVQGAGTVTLSEKNPSQNLTVNTGTYQMMAQATAANYEDSAINSTPVYLPKYKPSIKLGTKSSSGQAQAKVDVTGTTLENLSINVTLDGSSTGIIETPPIYRAELVGTWTYASGTSVADTVFAQTDMLTVSNGITTASFTNLPEYISKVKDLKVRVWYAQSGLGPVYTYYDVDADKDSNDKILESVTEEGVENWKYQFTPVLKNTGSYFSDYQYKTTDKILTWLDKPELDQTSGTSLIPNTTSGTLKYTFSWDKKIPDGNYQISLTGIDAEGNRVTIDTSGYNGKNSYTANAEDWNYTNVELKVTRIGDEKSHEIGLSTEATYNVAQRLEQPGQPIVTNVDENELNYQISWNGITNENGCAGYQAYIRTYDASGNLGNASVIGSQVAVTEKLADGSYQELVNLEDYAGKRAVIYLVAKAATSGTGADAYIDSADGVTYELQIPNRIPEPQVTWSPNWSYNTDAPMGADSFTNGGLRINLKAGTGSIPPGGSAYLLKAYVYEDQTSADSAQMGATDCLAEYPAGEIPVQMDVMDSENYYHNLQNLSVKYAGKWIVFFTRISSGEGNVSSKWVKSSAYQLPYVKLAQPVIASDSKDVTVPVRVVTNPDLLDGEEQLWTAKRTELTWDSIECADALTMKLSGTVHESDTATTQKSADIRILEDQENHKVDVQQYLQEEQHYKDENGKDATRWVWVWKSVTEEVQEDQKDWPADQKTHLFKLDQYQVQIATSFGGRPTYLTLTAELEAYPKSGGGFTYVLRLPDITSVKNLEGADVTYSNFAITDSVTVQANVKENLNNNDTTVTNASKAYHASETTEVKWNK